MKAFLLAAGHGTRLRPLTDTIPKCLVPIQGVPLLRIWLSACETNGITEVLINLHAHADVVQQAISEYSGPVSVKVVEEKELLGSAGTLVHNREWLEDDPGFWVFYSDVLNTLDLRDMHSFHERVKAPATIAVYEVPDPRSCGIVRVGANGVVEAFKEKPEHPESNLAFSGLMYANRECLDLIPPSRPADIAFHLLPELVGRMYAYRSDAFVMDIGTWPAYQAAQSSWPGFLS